MNSYLNIMGKEVRDYFVSPIGYIVLSLFLFVVGWLFFSTFFIFGQANLRNFFSLLPITFSFIIPAVTMRLFSEELNTGSYEILLTMPVKYTDIILGKFLAGVIFVACMLIPTFLYPITISFIGQLDWGTVVGGYIGAILLGSAYCAIGVFASSVTRNQIVAFIIGTVICFSLTLVDKMLFFVPESILKIVSNLGADYHFQNISKGVIDTRDILYFLSIIFISLYGTYLVIEEKK